MPQFGYSDEVDMTELVHLRSMFRDKLREQEMKFSFMPVIIKALSLALRQFPILNATVNPECTTITEKADHNIGVAMDTQEGLVVPNVKQVQVGNRVECFFRDACSYFSLPMSIDNTIVAMAPKLFIVHCM